MTHTHNRRRRHSPAYDAPTRTIRHGAQTKTARSSGLDAAIAEVLRQTFGAD